MFITIRFGGEYRASVLVDQPYYTLDDEQLLFNPDCSPKILLDNIKRRCHVSQRGIYNPVA